MIICVDFALPRVLTHQLLFTGNEDTCRDLSREQKELERDLSAVTSQLKNISYSLKQFISANHSLESDVKDLKTNITNEINQNRCKINIPETEAFCENEIEKSSCL